VAGGVAGHRGRVPLRLDPVQVALGQLQAAGGGVDVGVGEPGQDQPAVQAQHPGGRPAQAGHLGLGADGGDPAGPHGHGVGPGPGRVGGVHRRPDEQEVGLGGHGRSSAGTGTSRSARAGQSTRTTSTTAAMTR
jgi:hypothetical protein